MTLLDQIDYALEEAGGKMVWQWFKLLCGYYAVIAYGQFHYLLPWG